MSNKFWDVLVIIYYISYLILFIPPFVLYFAISNSYRRGRNRRSVRRTLNKSGIPKELTRQVGKVYKKQLRTFTLWELMKLQRNISSSDKNEEKQGIQKYVKSFITV